MYPVVYIVTDYEFAEHSSLECSGFSWYCYVVMYFPIDINDFFCGW